MCPALKPVKQVIDPNCGAESDHSFGRNPVKRLQFAPDHQNQG